MISWLWVNRGLSGVVPLAALVAVAAVYVMSLRSDNAALAGQLAKAESRSAQAIERAERIRLQAEALIASRDAAVGDYADTLDRIRSAADACLDRRIPTELLDR